MATQPVVYIKEKAEIQDVGTTLKDLRETYPGCYLLNKHNNTIAHRADSFVLQNVEYVLVERAPTTAPITAPINEKRRTTLESDEPPKRLKSIESMLATTNTSRGSSHLKDAQIVAFTTFGIAYSTTTIPPLTNSVSSDEPESAHHTALYNWIKAICPKDKAAKDTHASGLINNPKAKIDISVVEKDALYTSLILPIEVKTILTEGNRNNGVGQLTDRFAHIFLQQPERKVVYGVLVSCQQVEVFCMERKTLILKTSGVKTFEEGSKDIVALLSAPLEALGYIKPVFPEETNLLFRLPNNEMHRCFSKTFQLIRPAFGGRPAILFCTTDKGLKFVVKAGGQTCAQIDNEYNILPSLKGCHKSIPEILACEPPILLDPFKTVLPLIPCGDCTLEDFFEEEDNNYVVAVLKFIHQIDESLQIVHSKGFCHGDVGPSNIVIKGEQAYLIDWGVSLRIGDIVKGWTLMYASYRVIQAALRGISYALQPVDDLESLFLTILHVLFGEALPWRHAKTLEEAAAFRHLYVNDHEMFDALVNELEKRYPSRASKVALKKMHRHLFPEDKSAPKNVVSLFK